MRPKTTPPAVLQSPEDEASPPADHQVVFRDFAIALRRAVVAQTQPVRRQQATAQPGGHACPQT